MRSEKYLLSIISGESSGIVASPLRGILGALSYVYSAGLKLFFLPYRLGIRRQTRLERPVISVGNLTVGGTGKTPMTQLVCEALVARGKKVCVLSRGYRGANEFGVAVVSTESKVELDAKAAGDEAYLLAKMLPGVPVIVGKDRRVSGKLAIERFKPDVIVLDDGMQYYWLHRDLEIVLLDALRPFDNGYAFPRGLLREPPSHLRRANAVIITNADKAQPGAIAELRETVSRLSPRVPVYTAQYAPVELRALDRSGERPPEWLGNRKVATFCALGNPAAFEEQVVRAGAEIVHSVRMDDHHAPTMGDLESLIAKACEEGAEAVIVSEKDAVKLPPLGRPLPFYALVVRQQVSGEAEFLAQVLRAVERNG
jgi:tetraacyldisaccharide 4'-kinase